MRVLHITNAYPTAENPIFGIFIKEQLDSLRSNGIHCDVLFIDARHKGKCEYLKSIGRLRLIVGNYDIVHCHHTYSGFIAKFLARIKKPVIVSFLSIKGGEGRHRLLTMALYSLVRARVDRFIVKDDNDVEKEFPGRGYYAPNGVDLDRFRESDRNEAQAALGLEPAVYLLFVSGGNKERKEKRYDLFKKTVEIVRRKTGSDIRELVMIQASRLDVPTYFNASSVHLLTSDFEGSPNSVKEALACNIPVVSTNVGNVRELIGDIPGCFVSNANDPEELASYVIRSLDSTRIEGRKYLIAKELDSQSIARKIIQIYKSML